MTFYWLTPFAYSFVNSDWLELVIYFHTYEHDGEQNAFTVRLSDNSDKFWDRDNSRRTEESHIFFDVNDVSVSLPTGYGKSSIYQAALVVDRFSSPEEPFAINLLPKCTLAERILRLSFNFKLKLLFSCSDCFD